MSPLRVTLYEPGAFRARLDALLVPAPRPPRWAAGKVETGLRIATELTPDLIPRGRKSKRCPYCRRGFRPQNRGHCERCGIHLHLDCHLRLRLEEPWFDGAEPYAIICSGCRS